MISSIAPNFRHRRAQAGACGLLVRYGLISAVLGLGLIGSSVWAQTTDESPQAPIMSTYPGVLAPQAPLSLPSSRPKLTLSLPLGGRVWGLDEASPALFDETNKDPEEDGGRFSLSLEAWQLNTASLAHIQCAQHTLTLESFVAQNCQFVDQPVPENAVNLVQVQGQWTAAPNLNVGLGVFQSQSDNDTLSAQLGQPLAEVANLFGLPSQTAIAPAGNVEGINAQLSFGIEVERVGEFLLGLQLARYRQRASLMDLGDPRQWAAAGRFDETTTAAQLNLAWQRGNFRGDLLGRYVDRPIRLAQLNGETITAPPSGFDLEFSWQPGNASFSIGVSNVLDGRGTGTASDGGNEENVRDIYGRIPYVRYKQDL